jgi:hypothetical protein
MSEATLWREISWLWRAIDNDFNVLYKFIEKNAEFIDDIIEKIPIDIGKLETKLVNVFTPIVGDLQTQITNNNNTLTSNLDAVVSSVVGRFTKVNTRITTNITYFDGLIRIVEDKIGGVSNLLNLTTSRIDNKLTFLEGLFLELGKDLGVSELTSIGDEINRHKTDLMGLIEDAKGVGVLELFSLLQTKLHPIIDFINQAKLVGIGNANINKIHQANTLTGLATKMEPLRNQLYVVVPKSLVGSPLANLLKKWGL